MTNKIILSALILSLLLISACAQTTVQSQPKAQEPVGVDVVGETRKIKEIQAEEEPEEISDEEEITEEEEISPEVKELLGIADKKVQSLRYSYKGPDTERSYYQFFVKGDNIKYIIDPTYKDLRLEEDAYDAIYLDKESKTAQAYCDDRTCRVKGKKADLNYDEVYIWTPLDWVENIEFAEKLGEQLIERKQTWRLSTTKLGTIWVDSFFGVAMQVELGENIYKFQNMVFNDLKDEDVVPS